MENLIDDGIKWNELLSLIRCGHTLTLRNVDNRLAVKEGGTEAVVDLCNEGFTHSLLRSIAGWERDSSTISIKQQVKDLIPVCYIKREGQEPVFVPEIFYRQLDTL